MTLSDYKDIATIAGVLIALAALIKGLYEYVKQGAQRRAEQFVEMRKRFKENETFRELAALIEDNDPKLLSEPFKNKLYYVGFFEEVALMVNSGLIKSEVAHYMFGYYAIRCWDNLYFWSDVNRDTPYWALFRDFVAKMRKIEGSFMYDERKFKF
ncbi:MAG TPA: hypothetical protein VF591_21040 [Pyrinomonadaceae bacterium]|jgi:hypothetical protein